MTTKLGLEAEWAVPFYKSTHDSYFASMNRSSEWLEKSASECVRQRNRVGRFEPDNKRRLSYRLNRGFFERRPVNTGPCCQPK